MSIALFSENLGNFPASRLNALNDRVGIECVYALVWPNYEPPIPPVPQTNRLDWDDYCFEARVPVWAWINCQADQAADVVKIKELDQQLNPAGWLLDIEGEWTKTANLSVLAQGMKALGKPARASLAGFNPAGSSLDFRSLEKAGIAVEWQSYFDSGEGPDPATAVRELYQCSFILPGWEYRHRFRTTYGWGKVTRVEADRIATFNSYLRPEAEDATFAVGPRPDTTWGKLVVGRNLVRNGMNVGLLMGRAAYANTRVALDVTRTAEKRRPEEWVSIAASARIPGSPKRGVAVYLAERASDDVIAGIAEGAQ